MSIRILTNAEDDMAVLYQSETDWAFGPVIMTDGISAKQMARKFLDWSGLSVRMSFQFVTDAWLQGRWHAFQSMKWRPCPECFGDQIIPESVEVCEKCVRDCSVCFDDNAEKTFLISDGTKVARYCGPCASKKFGKDHPGSKEVTS